MPNSFAPSFPTFLTQVQRINLVRWTFALVGAIMVLSFSKGSDISLPAMGVVGGMAIITATFELTYRSIHRKASGAQMQSLPLISRVFYIQVFLDVLFITVGIHVSGGPLSSLPMLYVLYTGMMAVLLPTKLLLILNVLTIGLYAGLLEMYFQGWWQPLPPPQGFIYSVPTSFLRGVEALYLCVMVLNGILVASRSRQIRQAWAEADDRRVFLDRLNELTHLSLSIGDLTAVCQTLADHLGTVLKADGAYLTIWDEATGWTLPVAAHGLLRDKYPTMLAEPGERTLTESLRQAGAPIVVEDVFHSPYLDPKIAAQFPSRSLLGLPLFIHADQKFLGAALIGYNKPHHFDQEEIQRGQQVAALVALLLTRTRLHQETAEKATLLQELNAHVTHLTSDLRQETLLPDIVESARTLLKAQRAALFLYEQGTKNLTCAYSVGLSKAYLSKVKACLWDMPGAAVLGGEPFVLIADVQKDPRAAAMRDLMLAEGYQALAAFSLPSPRGSPGGLCVYWDQVHATSSAEVLVGRLFAARTGAVLHNASLFAAATEEANTDALTCLPNRRSLDQRMEVESYRTKRYKHAFTFIMMDMDSFKQVNDTFGHPVGDTILQHCARTLRGAVRSSDFLARYGGDEFALILPETEGAAALRVAEKLAKTFANDGLVMPDGSTHYLSLCMGLAVFPYDSDLPQTLVNIADRRLYHAKRTAPGTIVTRIKSDDTPTVPTRNKGG